MRSSNQRLLGVAALVFTMSAIVALVVLSPLAWRDGSSPEPAAEAVPAQEQVAEVVAAPKPATPAAREPDRSVPAQPAASSRAAFDGSSSDSQQAPETQPVKRPAAPTARPVALDKKGKAKGHEKKALGSKKTGKHDHHAQGAAGKGHGKGKSKDRNRAPAWARG